MGNVAVAGVVNKAKNQFVKKVESSRAEKAEGHSGSGQVPQASKGRNPVLHQILCNVQRSAQRAGKSSSGGSQEPMEATDDSTSAPPSEDRTCHPVMNLIVGNVQQRAIDAHFDRLPKSEPAADEEPAGYCCSINTLADGTKIGSTEQVATEGQQESVGADQPSMLRSLGTQIRARLQRRVTAQAATGERVEVPVQAAHTNLGEHNSDIISVSLSEYRDLQNGHRATRAMPALRSAPMTVKLPEFLKEPTDDSPLPGKLEARKLLVQIPLLPTAPYGTKSSPYSPISRSPLYRQPRGSTAPAGQTRGGGVLSPGGRTRVARNSLFNLEKPGSPPSSRHGSFLKVHLTAALVLHETSKLVSLSLPYSASLSLSQPASLSLPYSASLSLPYSAYLSQPIFHSLSSSAYLPQPTYLSQPISHSLSFSACLTQPFSACLTQPLSAYLSQPIFHSLSSSAYLPLTAYLSQPSLSLTAYLSQPISHSLSFSAYLSQPALLSLPFSLWQR